MVPAQTNSASSGWAMTTAIFFGPVGSLLVSAASRATWIASASTAADGSLGAASRSVSLVAIVFLPLSLSIHVSCPRNLTIVRDRAAVTQRALQLLTPLRARGVSSLGKIV